MILLEIFSPHNQLMALITIGCLALLVSLAAAALHLWRYFRTKDRRMLRFAAFYSLLVPALVSLVVFGGYTALRREANSGSISSLWPSR